MGVNVADNKAFPLGQHAEDIAPGIDQHAVTPGAATVDVLAALRRRQHITLVFNRAGAQQQLPVRLAGGVGKRRRYHNQRAIAHGPVQLGKTQVVAHRQANLAERRLEALDVVAVDDGARFVIRLFAACKTEQMDLVVTRHAPACGIIDQRGIEHLAIFPGNHRQRAADQPDLVLARQRRHEILDLAGIDLFGVVEFDFFMHAHDGPIFRQQDELRALLLRLRDQPGGGGKVLFDLGRRHHLYRRDFIRWIHFSLRWVRVRHAQTAAPISDINPAASHESTMCAYLTAGLAPLPTSALRSCLTTSGSLHEPVTLYSKVSVFISGLRKNSCARKVPTPTTGLIASATSDAVPRLTSGITTRCRFCVSLAMSAEPFISTEAATPVIFRLSVVAMPCAMDAVPTILSNAKPSENTSRKSSARRRGKACKLSTPSSLAAPGSTLRNWPVCTSICTCPLKVGMSSENGKPFQLTSPSSLPLPPRTTPRKPKRSSSLPASLMSSA